MEVSNILKSAHIHIETTTFRVHVSDASLVDIKMMNEDENKPVCVNDVSRSNDPSQRERSILVHTSGDYDIEELADWINSYI